MSMKLTSNRLKVVFNYTNINKNYLFFKFETSEKYIKGGASFLDLHGLSYVRSVSYVGGKSFFVMTETKDVSRRGIIKALNEYEGGDSLSIIQLKAEELEDCVLLQLFLNSLSNPNDELCSYNNLSGKLLCYKSAWFDKDEDGNLWGLDCMEIRISKDMSLHMHAHRMTSLKLKNKMKFEKRKLYEYPQYEFSFNNHTLRRVDKAKLNDKSNLIQKPINGEKGNITFFDFTNYDAFSCTKIGLLYEIMGLVKQEFGEYFSMSFKRYDINEVVSNKRPDMEGYKRLVEDNLLESGINIIDEVNSSTSGIYLEDICKKISDIVPGIRCSVGKRLSKKKVNIRYIHDKQFYGEDDPHNENLRGYVVQHITVENFNHKTKAAVSNILKELVIKKDLRDGKLSIIDWQKFKYTADWIFGTVIDKEYFFLNIHPDGSFDIKKMVRDIFNMTEYERFMDYFNIYDDQVKSEYSGVVGLIRDSNGKINLIKDTPMFTIPDFDSIGNILSAVAEKASFSGEDLILLLKKTVQSSDDKLVKTELERIIPSIDPKFQYDKKAIMGLMKGRNAKKAFVKNVYNDTGVLLYAYLRDEEARSEYLSGTIDINYFDVSKDTARYCVGKIGSGMDYIMDRASIIREVQAVDNSKLLFKELLPLMGVEFVRLGMLTVMPFPFKYLREFAALEHNK